jgi:ribosomal protein S18 acetylase RimI-like enzyme
MKAMIGEEVVGFVFGDRRRRQKVGWIASIGVHPDMRRKGIGYLRPSNLGAKQLYLKAGYVEVDHWDRYYANGEDAIIMEKNL